MKKNVKPYTFEVFAHSKLNPATTDVEFLPPQWYWRLRAANGKIIADGSEAYNSKSAAKAAVRRLWKGLAEWGVLAWRVD